ncbi:MAG: hypothetical protein ALECFALPRED_004052 [Alectoria fallacina]|uniref:DUF2786 domain-containing protein n=1 Tax=Alectoria fallacina TaxID=1903189 RepID=A0A8H3FSR9_9LECA|nr:MAG: hypothetical protein ALECFALPRED_004052 [Alectoria fallacina]
MPSKRELKFQKAAIGWLANEETATQALSNVDKAVMERIRKCFARANHANGNENEQRAAFKMAHKIMKQYSISQAELIEEEDKIARAERGGMSTVNIWPAKEGAHLKHQVWVKDLVSAFQMFFDCSAYSTVLPDNIEWTFYGVVGHTVSAAMAFEPVHNQIQTWASKYSTVAMRNSYTLGVAEGLCRLAEEEQVTMEIMAMETEQKALAARIRAEDIQEQVELDRIRNPPPLLSSEPVSEPEEEKDAKQEEEDTMDFNMDATGGTDDASDDEAMPDFNEKAPGEKIDTMADFDTELRKFIKPEPSPEPELNSFVLHEEDASPPATTKPLEDPAAPSENEDTEIKSEETLEWRSMRQLTVFRQNVKEIEETVIREKGLKLKMGRKPKRSVKDRNAFRQGRKDAKDMNVRTPRIEDGKVDLPEVEDEDGSQIYEMAAL